MNRKDDLRAMACITRRSFVAAVSAALASCGGGGSPGAVTTGSGSGTGGGTSGGGGGGGEGSSLDPTPVMTPAASALTRAQLDGYLARSISMDSWSLFTSNDANTITQHQDNLRMIANVGAKHVAWAANLFFTLTNRFDLAGSMAVASKIASDLHAQDSDIIVAASIFETVGTQLDDIAVPSWVFQQFGQPVVARNFNSQKMMYSDGRPSDGNPNTPAIDITQLESRMWYYYWSKLYIDAGYEDLHFGELFTITQNDIPSYDYYWDLVGRVRRYAATNARRGFVLINANSYPSDSSGLPSWTGQHGVVNANGYLLLDYCYFPNRPRENPNSPQDAVLAEWQDTIFGRSRGGLSPNGWQCTSCPYVVALDPGYSPNPGHPVGWPYVWGWAEWDWYVNQPDQYRADWLWYANAWLAYTDSVGHYRMPGLGGGGGLPGIDWYHANIPWYSQSNPNAGTLNQWFKGFNDEPVIKTIWAGTADPNVLNAAFSRPVLGGGATDTTAPDVPSWSFSGQAGIAGTGSSYIGSQVLVSGQQVAFISGTSAIAQSLEFPGGKSYSIQISAAERVVGGVPDAQNLAVALDGTVVGNLTLGAAFATTALNLGTPLSGVHQVSISGSAAGTATAIIASVQIVA